MEFPVTFTEKMKAILGDEFDDFLKGYDRTRHYGLRVNRTKISAEQFERISMYDLKPVPWIDNAFEYEDSVSPAKHPYYFAGMYYLQEPSAMTPANLLPIEPGDRVLDLCAAPGGKATELGAKLNHTGLLVANDISNSRAKALLKNIELFGIPNVLVTSEPSEKLAEKFPAFFDKILIDAPCSGEGMFRKNPGMMKDWETYGPKHYSDLQRSIVPNALRMLKPGGMLLYSTCTFSPEENEGSVKFMMDLDPDLEIVDIASRYEGFAPGRPELIEDGFEDLKKCVRIWPHKMNGEGHFIALLRKKDNEEYKEKKVKPRKDKALPALLEEFMKDCTYPINGNDIEIQEDRVYLMPEGIKGIKGLRFLRSGLLLGTLTKDRFEPSQAFAMVLKKEQYKATIDLASIDHRVIRYLKGETIEVDDLPLKRQKGWQLVCVDGYPLGWGKLVNGSLRNKYLPGWRWQS
ncbi:MAG: RsmB/NOP family class I SAM-dependent RNA methyltransferase [Lachnospiraceae bacterium]|nr:RsmB/NOP family class I SAM-dependent RNA methyltransferase [Lachnospiraceae bacterium]